MHVISDPSDIDRFLPAKWADSFNSRKRAIEVYLRKGGIIKIGDVKGNWPKLLYPTPEKIESEIQQIKKEMERVDKQLAEARKRKRELMDTPDKKLKLLLDPLYWRHRIRLLTDKDYKEVYELVRPPVHLIHRPDWRRKIDLFLKSDEYRMRLKEARPSEIGRRRPVLEKEVEKRTEFSISVVDSLIDKLERKKKKLQERLDALQVLKGWAEAS